MKTLAITIGNNDYCEDVAKLNNAINDARAMAEVFAKLGYDVIHKEDCTITDCTDLLTDFNRKIKDYDATIFYFAGHGFQLDGENYLASIDCQVTYPNEYLCRRTCVMLTEVLDILKKNSDKVNIVIIDACRKSFERGGASSFTSFQAPKGTLIAFSTSPDEGAKDGGFEGHSLYTGSLLKYIGREWISVEDLFKKVRKTVFNLSEGRQTTWEHTSLIGDFYFNTGQLVYSLSIPYDESVVMDSRYTPSDAFGELITEIKSSNWNRQNPAIDKVLSINPNDLDKNQLFILGRNLLQASEYAYSASNFFDDLALNLNRYSIKGENHLLNGILFEIYFDSNGEFRKEHFKNYNIEKIFELRKNERFKKSFDFLEESLRPYMDLMFYIPMYDNNTIIDIDVLATNEKRKDSWGNEEEYQVISKINVLGRDITKPFSRRYSIHGLNILGLKNALAHYLFAPEELIQINNNIEINKIVFSKFDD